jgi:hypothetical protein
MREHAQTGKLRTAEQGLIRQSNAYTNYQLTEERPSAEASKPAGSTV